MAGHTTRRSRAELRELLLEAANELVLAEGIGVGGANITYKRVFAHLKETKGVRVTGASVHERIWPNIESFRLDVLRGALSHGGQASLNSPREAAFEVLQTADLSTVELRVDALREMIIQATSGQANEAARVEVERWLSVVSVFLDRSAQDDPELMARVTELVNEEYRAMTQLHGAAYREVLKLLGFQASVDIFGPPTDASFALAIEVLADSMVGLIDGFGLRLSFDQTIREPLPPIGSAIDGVDWNRFGLAVWSLVIGLFEPVTDWVRD